MTSQLVIFKAFFLFFFRPLDPKSEKKNPINQLIKKLLLITLFLSLAGTKYGYSLLPEDITSFLSHSTANKQYQI